MTESTARFTLDPAFTVGEADPRLFGSFVEHLGRCVYTGTFEPGHPTADEAGLRGDVLGLVRELGVTAVRYPGGDFVSGYKWEDSVGPADSRPRRLDLARHSTETSRFGLSEYIGFLRKAGPQTEPMLAQTTSFPFAQASRYGRGQVLDVVRGVSTGRTNNGFDTAFDTDLGAGFGGIEGLARHTLSARRNGTAWSPHNFHSGD